MTISPLKSAIFTVTWPIQGSVAFCTDSSELILSDVYWHWLLGEIRTLHKQEPRLPIVVAVESGFADPSNLIEIVSMDSIFLELLGRIDPMTAPSFQRLKPSPGCEVPTPEELLAAFIKVVSEATSLGTLKMQVD